jgi:tetratricopeptide (TPR) repeat protein
MANPKDLKRVFVVRDFATAGLEQALQNLIRRPGRDYELRAPGVVREGGEILRDVVLPGIMEARRVLVFVDQPNANVGFEAGLAIGLGKPTALVQLRNDPQEWLERPPLINTLVHRLEALPDLYLLLEDEAIWQQITLGPLRRNRRGRAPTTHFLCAGGTAGAPYRRIQENARPFWQRSPQENFTVRDLPRLFEDVFQMVWVIPEPPEHLSVYQGEGENGLDGVDNACNAVIAGWFCAQLIVAGESGFVGGQIRDRWDHVKRSLRVLRSAHFRPLRDVELLEQTFEGLGDFDALLQALPVAHLDAETRVRPLWSPGGTDRRPLPEMLREQVSRIQARAVELISGGEFDRALNELRASDDLSASLVDEWFDDPLLKLSRAYLLKTLSQALVYSGNAELSEHAANQALESFEAAMHQGAEGALFALELAEAINGMGNMLQHHGNLDDAIKCYRWATELVPSYAAAWHDLYAAYLRQRSTQDMDVRLLRETFDRMKEHAHGQPGLSSRYIAQLERRLLVLERPMGAEEKMCSRDAPELVQSILEELIRDEGELRVLLHSEDTPLESTSELWNTIEAADQALCEKREANARGLLEQILESAEPANQAEHEARARAASMMARLEAATHPERARTLAERATESIPQLPRTWYDIGGVWRLLDDSEGAIFAYERYLVLTRKIADHVAL